ncbi:hypothetical protein CGCF413_v014546 [Colletotrichum fructicola]|nr:hypothetical protein CGCF413_v014546 [Colletotrichum fructicola]
MDHFSAATGVAGLISLGIQLGKGLKTYCEDFQSMDDDIALLRTKPKGMRERWEAALTHFHYPLQKKRFEDLEAKMETFRFQLSARLQLLNYGPALESAASGLSLWLMFISSFLKPLLTWVSRLMELVHTVPRYDGY